MALSAARDAGFQQNPIRVSEVAAYCDLIGLADAEERLRMLEAVQILDREYLDIADEKQKRREEAEKKRRPGAKVKSGGRSRA